MVGAALGGEGAIEKQAKEGNQKKKRDAPAFLVLLRDELRQAAAWCVLHDQAQVVRGEHHLLWGDDIVMALPKLRLQPDFSAGTQGQGRWTVGLSWLASGPDCCCDEYLHEVHYATLEQE